MFSARTPRELIPNRLTNLIAEKRDAGIQLIDLTESNPTRIGLHYPVEQILTAISSPRALRYEPDPKGLISARTAVAEYYQERGITIDLDRIVLTASTSEAYTLLFKLLCEAGESVLVPVPSYPLFDHLARVESVEPLSYHLYYDGAWHIDFNHLLHTIEPHTRAIILVNPNNPTGSFLKQHEFNQLIEICLRHNLALISDEVFCDYAIGTDAARVASIAGADDLLSFSLNGLSKSAGLPQLKLGWITVQGRGAQLTEALARLEFIADLFLSVASPVQHALPKLLPLAAEVRLQIIARVAENRAWLQSQLTDQSVCRLLPAEGGWYAVLQVPRVLTEEELVLKLLAEDDLLVHPGYFFDFPSDGWLVIGLIDEPARFQTGASKMLARIDRLFG